MKILKLVLLPLLTIALSGCYTQLEYSQTMKRITEAKSAGGYSWSDDSEENDKEYEDAESVYIAETETGKEYVAGEYEEEYYDREYEEDYYNDTYEEEYYPVTYKDYNAVNRWNDCDCNPYVYNNYNFYGGHSYYPGYYSSSWSFSIGFGYHHHHNHYGFRRAPLVYYAGFGWGLPIGYPYSHHYYSTPHYYGLTYLYPFAYDSYFYGRSAFIFNAYYFNGNNSTGFVGSNSQNDVRAGRRDIGSQRVSDVRQRNTARRATTDQRFKNANERKKRTTGVTRIRSNTTRDKRSSAVQARKSRNKRIDKNARSRSKGKVIDNSGRQHNTNRSVRQQNSDGNKRYKIDDRRRRNVSRTRLKNRNNVRITDVKQSGRYLQKRDVDIQKRHKKRRSSFFGSFRNLLQIRSGTSSSNAKSVRYHKKSRKYNSKSYRKSNSRSKKSSVSRSRSSSGSKSKGSSSRSRSRSSNNDRSRGNN